MENFIKCPYCDEENVQTVTECVHCNEVIQGNDNKETKNCPYCDEENIQTATECVHCDELLDDIEEENDTIIKQCPNCREEILKVAIKCKHCHEWLDKSKEATPKKIVDTIKTQITIETKPCPVCSESIAKDATKCKHCGTWLNEFSKAKYEGTPIIRETEEIDNDVSTAAGIIYLECLIVYVLLYLLYDFKWWQGAIGYVIFAILLSITWIRLIYCFLISIVWGMLAMAIAPFIFNESDMQMATRIITEDFSDYMWLGIIVGIVSLVFHLPAISKDYNKVK